MPDCDSTTDGDVFCEEPSSGGDILDLIDSQQMKAESRDDNNGRRQLMASTRENRDDVNDNNAVDDDEDVVAFTGRQWRAVGRTCRRDDVSRRPANDLNNEDRDLELDNGYDFFM